MLAVTQPTLLKNTDPKRFSEESAQNYRSTF